MLKPQGPWRGSSSPLPTKGHQAPVIKLPCANREGPEAKPITSLLVGAPSKGFPCHTGLTNWIFVPGGKVSRTAFVIMPIRKEGTDEHAHFRTIYDDYIKPELEKSGYEVVRADEIQKSGAITRDIIDRLATADLVVADLTDLNANVFYELGVRHALHGRGCLMVIDEDRTSSIPFDLAAYRVHKYGTSSITAISPLRRAIANALETVPSGGSGPENPVHDWLPSLPSDVVRNSNESSEGGLRAQLASLKKQLKRYEDRVGHISPPSTSVTPQAKIADLLDRARSGRLPIDLARNAVDAVQEQDRVKFLSSISSLMEDDGNALDEKTYMRLAHGADQLGVPEASLPILSAATLVHPTSEGLRRLLLSELSHSPRAEDRAKARLELCADLGIVIRGDGTVEVAEGDSVRTELLGVTLDGFHGDGLHDSALQIVRVFAERFPHNNTVLRNFARALEKSGSAHYLELYRRAALSPGASDTSWLWLGHTLHNENRRRDAIEAYAGACRQDANDSTNWAHLAQELCQAMARGDEDLAKSGDSAWVLTIVSLAIACVMHCPSLMSSSLDTIRRAVQEIDKGGLVEEIMEGSRKLELPADLEITSLATVRDRIHFAEYVQLRFKSELTDPSTLTPLDLILEYPPPGATAS